MASPAPRCYTGEGAQAPVFGLVQWREVLMARSTLGSARLGRALILGIVLVTLSATVAVAGNGNNGTVKVHDGATDTEPVVRNEPHVCTFHLHFFFADAAQSGSWSIDQQQPTGNDSSGLSGTYLTDPNGEYQTAVFGLPVGHYSLSWQGRNDQNVKHKTFWVTCEGGGGGGGGIG
jgi:hypothetical protein